MNELQTQYLTGQNVYAVIRNSSAQVWNGTSFETFADADWNSYTIAVPEQGNGTYIGSFPSAITTPDTYAIEFYEGTGAESDLFLTGGDIVWDGGAVFDSSTMLASLEYVKDVIGITNTTYDSYLTNRIVAASDAVQHWCNRKFNLQSYTEYYDGPNSTTLMLNQRPVQSVTSVTLRVYSQVPEIIPGSDIIFNSKSGLISVNPESTFNGWFSYDYAAGQQGIQVIYTAGYPSIPYVIQEQLAKIVANQYATRGQDLTLTSEKIGDYQNTRRPDASQLITGPIAAALSQFKEFVV